MNIYGIVRKTKNIYNSPPYNHTRNTETNNIKPYLQSFILDQYTNKRRLCLTFVIILLITFKLTIVGVRSE